MDLLIASANTHKFNEYKRMIESKKLQEINLKKIVDLNLENLIVNENGNDFFENAEIKARAYFNESKLACFADDSGLIVPAINSAPGIFSARYAGIDATDKSNREKLLLDMTDIKDRIAYFVCVICFYDGVEKAFFEGRCYGKIIHELIGDEGFGYDPIFIPDGYSLTFAEMSNDQKNLISHRAIANEKFLVFLDNYITKQND